MGNSSRTWVPCVENREPSEICCRDTGASWYVCTYAECVLKSWKLRVLALSHIFTIGCQLQPHYDGTPYGCCN